MNYIVFDLEWNQSPGGKKYSNSRLPFEIIEIGAVKLNEERKQIDVFQRLIKPQVYNWIHDSIHEVIHVDYKDLADGSPFPEVVKEFLEWCGEDFAFFTWGNQDVMELQRNMKYYGLLSLLPGPMTYYDVQKVFGIQNGEVPQRRSLEYAIDELGIRKGKDFHRALADAVYTAKVLQTLDMEKVFVYSSVDVYQNPKKRKEEIFLSYPEYDQYIFREFDDKDRIMKDREITSTRCPICHFPAKRKIRWFLNNSKAYESLSLCQKHGWVHGKIRIRHTEDEKYYPVKTLKNVDEKAAEELREKRESLRLKKQVKRQSEKI